MSEFYVDSFGLRIRKEFEVPINEHSMSSGRWRNDVGLGALGGEDFYEWNFLLDAIKTSGPSFRMVELGCGYGRWLGIAWTTIRRLLTDPNKDIELLGVEPSPGRKSFFEQYMQDNGLAFDPKTQVYFAPVGVHRAAGLGGMEESEPAKGYGRSVVSGDIKVNVLPLSRIVFFKGVVDYLSMDVQGAELEAITGEDS